MTGLDLDERRFVAALHDHVTLDGVSAPDLDRLASTALRSGTRMRLRRQAVVGATGVAVAGIGAAALALGQGGPGTDGSAVPIATSPRGQHPSAHHLPLMKGLKALSASPSHHAKAADLSTAYAVLDAPGWTAPGGQTFALDEKLYYVNGQDSLSLNWRPAADYSPKWAGGSVVGHTTIDGDPADIYSDDPQGVGPVVGPVKDGRFLTLSGSAGLSVDELAVLATQVHRQ